MTHIENNLKYAEIALNIPVPDFFTYAIPDELKTSIHIGSRVSVHFRNKKVMGIVVDLISESKFENTKPIDKVLEPYPALDGELMQLTRWVADYYLCPPGEAIHAAAPPSGRGKYHPNLELINKKELYENQPLEVFQHLSPTDEQQEALVRIQKYLNSKKFNVALIYGVTGSGKTEIYLQSIAHTLAMKKNALILVPEIALTYQLIQRFKERFGEKVAVLHSGLRGKVRLTDWRRIRFGEARVIIGVRSAVFAPIRHLGLVIVDEEHEITFKQENSPRYNARDVAIMRAKSMNATVILGSATPSLESYYHAQTGKYDLIELTKRVDNQVMPKCRIIDMRQEWDVPDGNQIISAPLQKAIYDRMEKEEQVILFLNRRGFSTILLCRSCGRAVHCNHCSVPLTFHQSTNLAHCHYCGLRYNAPRKCPACSAELIRYLGLGTQQVESEIEKLIPVAKIARLDLDITKKRGQYEHVLENFITGKTDILIGTQMIAKGMHIPNVTLVGVISADMMLNLSDFRSAERAYALLTQVSGRAGRGDVPGEVLIQTYNPSHYALHSVLKGERHPFYERELKNRKKIFFPPYRRFLLVWIQHSSQEHSKSIAEHFSFTAKQQAKSEQYNSIDIFGPAPAPIFKMKNKFRYHVLIKGLHPTLMRELYLSTLTELPKQVKISGALITPDMDPLSVQ